MTIVFFVEFHPTCFFVKDLYSRTLLLQGLSRNRLYQWPSSKSTSNKQVAYFGEKAPMVDWHCWLGHHAPPIARRVVHSNKLPVSSNSCTSSICFSCQQGKSHCQHFLMFKSMSTNPFTICFFLMYEALLLYSLSIIKDYIFASLMTSQNGFGFFLWHTNLKSLLYLFV